MAVAYAINLGRVRQRAAVSGAVVGGAGDSVFSSDFYRDGFLWAVKANEWESAFLAFTGKTSMSQFYTEFDAWFKAHKRPAESNYFDWPRLYEVLESEQEIIAASRTSPAKSSKTTAVFHYNTSPTTNHACRTREEVLKGFAATGADDTGMAELSVCPADPAGSPLLPRSLRGSGEKGSEGDLWDPRKGPLKGLDMKDD